METNRIYLITRNTSKLKVAKRVLQRYRIKLCLPRVDFIEIQAKTSLDIARFSALSAARTLYAPVIREDHSLYINYLGIPGPYTRFIEANLPSKKLLEILRHADDRTGYFELAAVYAEPSGFLKEFVYQVPVYLAKEERVPDPRGGWSGILCLAGEDRAFTEYPERDRLNVWSKNYVQIGKFLAERRATTSRRARPLKKAA